MEQSEGKTDKNILSRRKNRDEMLICTYLVLSKEGSVTRGLEKS